MRTRRGSTPVARLRRAPAPVGAPVRWPALFLVWVLLAQNNGSSSNIVRISEYDTEIACNRDAEKLHEVFYGRFMCVQVPK